MSVSVTSLAKTFGDLRAVRGISFEVADGELFGIVGPDGAGKTTTLRMLAGVLRPTAGDAELQGISVSREPERVKHVIAYMSQRFGLYADLTVMENIEFYADLYLVPKAERARRLERLFEFSGLGPFRDRLAGKLSGGMKQKLGLSCALIHEPQILLLDEPTFGVDPISRRDLWIIVHEMVARGVTTIVSTSYMDEAERFDRVAFLNQGEVVALDTPDALLRALRGHLLRIRVSDARRAKELAQSLPAVRRAVVFGNDLHLTVDDPSRSAVQIEEALRAEGLTTHSAEEAEPSLEDVFIEKVTGAAA